MIKTFSINTSRYKEDPTLDMYLTVWLLLKFCRIDTSLVNRDTNSFIVINGCHMVNEDGLYFGEVLDYLHINSYVSDEEYKVLEVFKIYLSNKNVVDGIISLDDVFKGIWYEITTPEVVVESICDIAEGLYEHYKKIVKKVNNNE